MVLRRTGLAVPTRLRLSYTTVVFSERVNLQQTLADGFAGLVRSAPDRWLEQLLSTPARRPVLDGIFWQMPQHINRETSSHVNAVVHWRITNGADGAVDVYELVLEGGRCHARRGPLADPQLTITLGAAEFIRLATGISDPVKAYFTGRLALGGDLMLAAKMQGLFRIPRRGESDQPRSTVSSSR
jgi:putative sterol carrier protein